MSMDHSMSKMKRKREWQIFEHIFLEGGFGGGGRKEVTSSAAHNYLNEGNANVPTISFGTFS